MMCESLFYDTDYPAHEQMPRFFYVDFCERRVGDKIKVSVSIDGTQVGDALTDNAYPEDGYRYHDIFHLSYLAVLGWSACMRQLLGRKRRSNLKVDEAEDGARATSVEEGLTSTIFTHAEQCNFFEGQTIIDNSLLRFIKCGFSKFEVKDKSLQDWQQAILTGFSAFRQLRKNGGGRVEVDMYKKSLRYVGECVNVDIINAL